MNNHRRSLMEWLGQSSQKPHYLARPKRIHVTVNRPKGDGLTNNQRFARNRKFRAKAR